MYSKRMTEFTRRYLARSKADIKETGMPALPVYKTTGMKDFVAALCGVDAYEYADMLEKVIGESRLTAGGYLEPKGRYCTDGCIVSNHDYTYYAAMMDAYDKYLCTDGIIRYRPTPESVEKFNRIYEEEEKVFWDRINDAFEAMGMFYNEEKDCWVNPETGEEGSY